MICSAATGDGTYAGAREIEDLVIRFAGCESAGHQCTTEGAPEGVLETPALEAVLGWEAKQSRKVALELAPAGSSGAFLEYRCTGGVPVSITGSVLVPIKAEKMAVSTALKFKATRGIQKPERPEGKPITELTATFNNELAEPLGISSSFTLANEEAVEINAVA